MARMQSLANIGYEIATGKIAPRPVVYKGIEFRSMLEARFAARLDALGERWQYEPRVYGPKGRGYLPDFEIIGADRPTFIEVKPTALEVAAAKAKMSVIWESQPDALLIVACQEAAGFYAALRGGEWAPWQELWVV